MRYLDSPSVTAYGDVPVQDARVIGDPDDEGTNLRCIQPQGRRAAGDAYDEGTNRRYRQGRGAAGDDERVNRTGLQGRRDI